VSPQEEKRLEALLEHIDTLEGTQELGPLDEEDSRLLAELQGISRALHRQPLALDEHFTLAELQELARERQHLGDEWVMPDHLSACPLCLEEFELVLEGLPSPRATVLRRYFAEGRRTMGLHPGVLPLFSRTERWAAGIAAAVLLVALGVIFNLNDRPHAPQAEATIQALDEAFVHLDGSPLPAGRIRAGTPLLARRDGIASFADDSYVEVEAGSRLSFHPQSTGMRVELLEGALTASVAEQTGRRTFQVATPLGLVKVVGTRFRVNCRPEEIIRLRDAARDSVLFTVSVEVLEGVVEVRRTAQSKPAEVRAGQTAILHKDQPGVLVRKPQAPSGQAPHPAE
jgi:hypothetical protein